MSIGGSNMVLVVDDDEFQLDVISTQLNQIGWREVVCASSGEQALALFDHYGPTVNMVICDLSMPDMDGLVLMRHLAQRGFQSAIVLLSGVQNEILHSAAGLARAHGMNLVGVLSKPSSPERLQELLSDLHPQTSGRNIAASVHLTLSRLSQAFADHEFLPWYQPKVNMDTGKAMGVEALARWPQPNGTMINPSSFVTAIESMGLAEELFFAIAKQVVVDLAAWRRQGLSFKVAVNMSMETAHNLSLPEKLGNIVNESGLQPSDLVIEVTESQLMIQRSLATESLTRLSLMGFTLSIDDFGTGYSSLSQLIDLPFKELKIDGSFVRRTGSESKAQAIVRVAIALGNHLGMNVVAEGVETARQLEFLRDCGGSTVQGYYFAKPMPFDACTEWLQRNQLG